MNQDQALVEIEEILIHLDNMSYVASRDAKAGLDALQQHTASDRLFWLETARDLFFHDREAGKTFMRGSIELAEVDWPIAQWVEQAKGFNQWVNSFRALSGYMEQAGAIYREYGTDVEQRWYDIGLRWCARNVVDAKIYFATDFNELEDGKGLQGLEEIIEPAEKLFDERGLTLDVYLQGSLIARRLVGIDGVLSWARRGADIMQSGRSRGEQFFKLETDESLALLLDGLPGFRPRQHSRFLSLLAGAWLDIKVVFADSEWRPGKGRPMIETDGRKLFVPAVLPDREETLLATMHAAAHLRCDSYERDNIQRLFEKVGMQHPPIDADQRITWRPLYINFAERMFRFQVLFDFCEDLRVNHRLNQLMRSFLNRLIRIVEKKDAPTGNASVFYEFALKQYRLLSAGEHIDIRLHDLLHEDADIITSFECAEQLFADDFFPELSIDERDDSYLPAHGLNTERAVYPRKKYEEGGYNNDNDAYAENEKEKEKQKDEEVETTQELRQKDPDPDINVPQENTSGSGGRIGVGIPMPAQVIGRGATREMRSDGVPYPEWDYREQRYLNDWTTVQELLAEEAEEGRAEDILKTHAGALKRLRSALEMQRPSRLSPLRRQMDGDELDLESLIGFVSEKKAGLSPKAFIYKRRAVQHRDTAVLLLADMSTSIMARHPEGNGKIVDHLRSGLLIFSEAINDLGDSYGIYGFASKNHDNVNFYRIKDFTENLQPSVRNRIAGISGRLASRMGAAIRHSLAQFEGVDAHHRLLLILSDGRPADYDDGGDQRYLHEDTRMAMKEAIDQGVHPFCITLDRSGSEYLPAIFGPGHYTIIDHVDELPARLPEIYLRLRK